MVQKYKVDVLLLIVSDYRVDLKINFYFILRIKKKKTLHKTNKQDDKLMCSQINSLYIWTGYRQTRCHDDWVNVRPGFETHVIKNRK